MKKLFTIVALAFCALTINAQTTLSFSEVKVLQVPWTDKPSATRRTTTHSH